jgi:spermidine/putrescine transport system permease protein
VLAPYLLTLPAGLWLLVLFLIPLVVMLSLSLQTCNPATGACVMTWHWGEFGQQLSLYHTQFVTSIYFAGAATLIDLLVSFPIAYWIAFYGGRRKNFFLLMLLVPFFVSFVIRTVVWQFILSDQGIILGGLKNIGLLPQNFHILATGWAVIAGLAYNYLPFTALPLYVAIERIDKRVLDAAYDLYATKREAFLRVILPLTIPGMFAAFLLTFIPPRRLREPADPRGHRRHHDRDGHPELVPGEPRLCGRVRAVDRADGRRPHRHLRVRPDTRLAHD